MESQPPQSIGISIVGASGYTGAELISIFLRHPSVKIAGLFGSEKSSGEPALSQIHPRFRGLLDLKVRPAEPNSILKTGSKAVFLATPAEISHELAPALLEKGVRVIDLSGAFRSPEPDFYAKNYDFIHRHPALLKEAVYGIPELFGEALPSAKLVANAGCYPTSILLPLKPLVDAKLLELSSGLIADSISGVSGAGRQAKPDLHFSEVSARAYGVFSHRHQPEMETWLGAPLVFVPHLAPFDRGMLSTIHACARKGIREEEVRNALATRYRESLFVRILPAGAWPSVKDVVGTNFCDIGLALDAKSGRLILVSALDNLLKGASGQAVQNFNLMMGLPETTGIL